MIIAIEIENFKGIGDRVRIGFKPITLLFGANSSGKSTILHALQYADEVFRNRNLDVHKTESGGGSVDLGGYGNIVHQHDLGRRVRLRFDSNVSVGDWDLPPVTAVGPYFATVHIHEEHMPRLREAVTDTSIEIEVAWSELRKRPYVSRYSVGINGEHLAAITCEYNRREVYLTEINPQHPMFQVDDELSILEDVLSDFEGPTPTVETQYPIFSMSDALPQWGTGLAIDALPDEDWRILSEDRKHRSLRPIAPGTERFVALFSSLMVTTGERLKDDLNFFLYLGPLREIPSRLFRRPSAREAGRWASGLAAWDLLLVSEDDVPNVPAIKKFHTDLLETVSRWLSDPDLLGIGYRVRRDEFKEIPVGSPLAVALSTERLSDFEDLKAAYDQLPVRRRLVLITPSGMEIQPQDVGVGVSQVVPVVVLAIVGAPWGVAAFEQPELHLHPKVQVRLGDLFSHACKTRTGAMLIETHSEHLLLRLLRRIRETTEGELPPGHPGLKPSEVAVLFVEQGEVGKEGGVAGTRIYPLQINESGEFIDQWPHGFFEERAEELF